MKSLGIRDKNKLTIKNLLSWYQLVKPETLCKGFEYQSPHVHELLQIPQESQTRLEGPHAVPVPWKEKQTIGVVTLPQAHSGGGTT